MTQPKDTPSTLFIIFMQNDPPCLFAACQLCIIVSHAYKIKKEDIFVRFDRLFESFVYSFFFFFSFFQQEPKHWF